MRDDVHRLPRFLAPDACRADQTVTLAPDQSRHLAVVLRLGAGDPVRLFDGQGNEFVGRVEPAEAPLARVRITERCEAPRPASARLVLAFAPAPGQRTEMLVEKATELGVDCLQPLICERVQGFQAGAAERRADRWRRKAEDAARQSQRTVVPELRAPIEFEAFVGALEGGLNLIASPVDGRGLWGVLAETAEEPSSVTMVVGPAGGFTRRELDVAVGAGLVPVSLGPHVLRVETAAVSLVAAVGVWLEGLAERRI
jgi:16S rRNA (uracil1498-N3)-methyltransferase